MTNEQLKLRPVLLSFAAVVIVLIIAALFVPKGMDVLVINGNHNPRLDLFLSYATHLGDGWAFIPAILIFLRVNRKLAALFTVAWIGHGLVCSLLKRQVFGHLERPIALLDRELLHFVPNVEVHASYSFPSGHTATAFCLAVLISLFYNRTAVTTVCMLAALLVGYSRIYLLQHFLMDVAAGALIGAATAVLVWNFFHHRTDRPGRPIFGLGRRRRKLSRQPLAG